MLPESDASFRNFLEPLANAKDFTPAKLGMLPAERALTDSMARCLPDRCVAVESMSTARGLLSAIAYYFKNKNILLPAYHCPAMVEPFLFHQCNIEFYRVSEQLEFDEVELKEKLPNVDIVVGVRFFGFSCQMERLKDLAVETNTLMVEDLAHAAFVKELYGDLAVTSLKKFYPIATGAELYITNPDWVGRLKKSVRALTPSFASSFIEKVVSKLSSRPRQAGFRYFSPTRSHAAIATNDHHLLEHYNHSQSAQRRRENYISLDEALKGLGFVESLFPDLEDDVVPYVYPVIIKDERFFALIRQKGIPLYRWEEIIKSHCPVSLSFRKLLIQLPCHQDLTVNEIAFIVDAFREIDQLQGQDQLW